MFMNELLLLLEGGLRKHSYSIEFSNVAEQEYGFTGHIEFTKNKQDSFTILFWDGITKSPKLLATNEVHPSVQVEFTLIKSLLLSADYQLHSFGLTEENTVHIIISREKNQFALSLFPVLDEEEGNFIL